MKISKYEIFSTIFLFTMGIIIIAICSYGIKRIDECITSKKSNYKIYQVFLFLFLGTGSGVLLFSLLMKEWFKYISFILTVLLFLSIFFMLVPGTSNQLSNYQKAGSLFIGLSLSFFIFVEVYNYIVEEFYVFTLYAILTNIFLLISSVFVNMLSKTCNKVNKKVSIILIIVSILLIIGSCIYFSSKFKGVEKIKEETERDCLGNETTEQCNFYKECHKQWTSGEYLCNVCDKVLDIQPEARNKYEERYNKNDAECQRLNELHKTAYPEK